MSINSELNDIVDDLFLAPDLVELVGGAISSTFKQNWGDLQMPSVAIGFAPGRMKMYGAVVHRTLHVYCYASTFAQAAEVYEAMRLHLAPSGSQRTISCDVRNIYENDVPLEIFSEEHATYGYRGSFRYFTIR